MLAGVLDLAARLTADARDIRMGVDLVRAAATRAGKEGRSRVTRRDVLDVVTGVKSPVLAALSSGERALLYQLAEQSLAGDTVMVGAIFEEAQEYIAVGKTTYRYPPAEARRCRDNRPPLDQEGA